MNSKDFQPAIRFTVVSDIHYHEDEDVERQRMAHALEKAYELAESSPNYKRLDAIFVNGDFTNKIGRAHV